MNALDMILSGDHRLFSIVGLSLFVTLSATVLACVFGMPMGALIGLTAFADVPPSSCFSTAVWACRPSWSD